MRWNMIAATAGIMAISANAATIDYLGSSESGDIANAGHWGGNAVPTANDTARFPDAFLSPVAGLSLGGSLVFGNIAWDDTSSRELDLGGKTLTLDDSSGTSQLSLGANATLTIKNGTLNVDDDSQPSELEAERELRQGFFGQGSQGRQTCGDRLAYRRSDVSDDRQIFHLFSGRRRLCEHDVATRMERGDVSKGGVQPVLGRRVLDGAQRRRIGFYRSVCERDVWGRQGEVHV